MQVETVHAQYTLDENIYVSVEEDGSADGGPDDPQGVFLSFGGVFGNGVLVLAIPDALLERLLLAALRDAPRLSSRFLAQAESALAERVEAARDDMRARLDPDAAGAS